MTFKWCIFKGLPQELEKLFWLTVLKICMHLQMVSKIRPSPGYSLGTELANWWFQLNYCNKFKGHSGSQLLFWLCLVLWWQIPSLSSISSISFLIRRGNCDIIGNRLAIINGFYRWKCQIDSILPSPTHLIP